MEAMLAKCLEYLANLIAALATDVVLAPLVHPKHNVVIITLLVTNGYLDRLCMD